jgi:hypothetical protein
MMMDSLAELVNLVTWRTALIGVSIFLVSFFVNLAIVSFILVKLPVDHFKKGHHVEFWSGPRPALNAAKMIGKNILGILLVLLGIILSLPGVPGQGLLTVLLGIMLVDFPGKTSLERKLLSRKEIVSTINRLRAKFDKPPLELE